MEKGKNEGRRGERVSLEKRDGKEEGSGEEAEEEREERNEPQ